MSIHDFDPNKPLDDGKTPVYGVYKGGKTMKTFTNRGHALSSFAHGYQAKMFQMVHGRWVEIAYRPNSRFHHKAPCDCCGGPTKRVLQGHTWSTESGRWCWDKVDHKIVEPLKLLWTCGDCRYSRGL